MLNIIERLDREKFAPAVCVLRKGGDLDREVERLGIPFIEAPFTVTARPYHTLPARAWKAAQIFRPHRFAIWHSFHYSDDYSEPIIARLSGAKIWIYTKKAMGWGSRAWLLRSYLSTKIVADNCDMPRLMFDRIGLRRKVQVIHHGLPLNKFTPETPARLRIKERLGITPEEVLVGCVAHFVPVKGHPTLLRALARVPQAHLVLAGEPMDQSYTDSLKQLAHQLKIAYRVHFIGGVQDVSALLSEIDIFVLPTWARWRMEGCPIALLEAMACGRACIATDIPGARDLIDHQHSGWLVPPEDVAALGEALSHLADAPDVRSTLGKAARERVVQHFSIEKEVEAHERLYSKVLTAC